MVLTGPFFIYPRQVSDPLAAIDRLIAENRLREAVDLVTQAARSGDRNALFRLAMWRIIGEPIGRDLVEARKLLRQSASLGHEDAQVTEIAMIANGSGGTPDWSSARRMLEECAADNPLAAASLDLVLKMALDAQGTPSELPRKEPLAPYDSVIRYPALLSSAECNHIAQTTADLLAPSLVVDPSSGKQIANPIRTSDAAIIGPLREDLAIRAINQRIAAVSETAIDQGEALTVLRYQAGQQYRPHLDAIAKTRNERIKTVIVYLNEGFVGGETVFPAYGLEIKPKRGDAIVFLNTLASGAIDQRSRHSGEPVTAGAKWIATRWIRERPYDPWTGPESVPVQNRS